MSPNSLDALLLAIALAKERAEVVTCDDESGPVGFLVPIWDWDAILECSDSIGTECTFARDGSGVVYRKGTRNGTVSNRSEQSR